MKIVIAPDSFKGSLTASQVADAVERGIEKVYTDASIVKVPMADGGEGTAQSLVDATNGHFIKTIVKDPLMRDIEACYGILGDEETVVIEMAAASGLTLLKQEEQNPLIATTFGTGQLIMHALNQGCRKFIIGIGGSATNDGGAGAMQALGIKLIDTNGKDIGLGGGVLKNLQTIDMNKMDDRIKQCRFTVACDVDNPLCGSEGASHVFGPQKGADRFMVDVLDNCLNHFGNIIEKDLKRSIKNSKGAGAAGGFGGSLMAFLDAELNEGIHIVINAVQLEKKIKNADIVLTGEGKIDNQTAYGKTPMGVASLSKKHNIPVIGICGSLGEGHKVLYNKGFDSIFSIIDRPMALKDAVEDAEQLIVDCSERIMRVLKIIL